MPIRFPIHLAFQMLAHATCLYRFSTLLVAAVREYYLKACARGRVATLDVSFIDHILFWLYMIYLFCRCYL